MMFRKLTAAVFLSLFLFSCSEDGEQVTVERTNSDYWPNTVGSTWTYDYMGDFTETRTIVNKAKEIGGKKYFAIEFENSLYPGSSLAYFRKDESNLISREPMDGMYEANEVVMFKEGPVGTTWTFTYFPDTENELTTHLEIVEVDGVYTFNDEEFTDVMVVKAVGTTPDVPENPYYSLNYYAKGIGYIRSVDSEGETLMEMVSYTIK